MTRNSIPCAIATAIVAATVQNDVNTARAGLQPLDGYAMNATELTDTIDVRYYGSGDVIADSVIGFVEAFVLTNPDYPYDCGCYSSYHRCYYHHFQYLDRFYHFGHGYRDEWNTPVASPFHLE